MDCYVLIGGRSSRMGVPKAKLRFGDSTILDRVLDAASVFDRIIAVERAGGGAGGDRFSATIHEPKRSDRGPIFAVVAALRDARERCWILAVDYPLLTAELLRRLSARFVGSGTSALIPVRRGEPQPLCAGYDPTLLPFFEERIAQQRYDLRAVVRLGETVDCDGDELINVNTPADLEEARNAYERQRLRASR